ncbi:unnamed protein product [Vitrella brassicaformis CCMP3155]|uniref:Uncharacterized protein n=3 Tax=Vitrella brassicaformis TaxID=1169539 RepID=A0A0G4EWA6_VITBC|nr:unnamed protein product [Vitrella brassicaformis CCMP3155]|eukprot:CEM02533.1 unnamed protein product [Vitrella brassicaformis CCMP3155]
MEVLPSAEGGRQTRKQDWKRRVGLKQIYKGLIGSKKTSQGASGYDADKARKAAANVDVPPPPPLPSASPPSWWAPDGSIRILSPVKTSDSTTWLDDPIGAFDFDTYNSIPRESNVLHPTNGSSHRPPSTVAVSPATGVGEVDDEYDGRGLGMGGGGDYDGRGLGMGTRGSRLPKPRGARSEATAAAAAVRSDGGAGHDVRPDAAELVKGDKRSRKIKRRKDRYRASNVDIRHRGKVLLNRSKVELADWQKSSECPHIAPFPAIYRNFGAVMPKPIGWKPLFDEAAEDVFESDQEDEDEESYYTVTDSSLSPSSLRGARTPTRGDASANAGASNGSSALAVASGADHGKALLYRDESGKLVYRDERGVVHTVPATGVGEVDDEYDGRGLGMGGGGDYDGRGLGMGTRGSRLPKPRGARSEATAAAAAVRSDGGAGHDVRPDAAELVKGDKRSRKIKRRKDRYRASNVDIRHRGKVLLNRSKVELADWQKSSECPHIAPFPAIYRNFGAVMPKPIGWKPLFDEAAEDVFESDQEDEDEESYYTVTDSSLSPSSLRGARTPTRGDASANAGASNGSSALAVASGADHGKALLYRDESGKLVYRDERGVVHTVYRGDQGKLVYRDAVGRIRPVAGDAYWVRDGDNGASMIVARGGSVDGGLENGGGIAPLPYSGIAGVTWNEIEPIHVAGGAATHEPASFPASFPSPPPISLSAPPPEQDDSVWVFDRALLEAKEKERKRFKLPRSFSSSALDTARNNRTLGQPSQSHVKWKRRRSRVDRGSSDLQYDLLKEIARVREGLRRVVLEYDPPVNIVSVGAGGMNFGEQLGVETRLAWRWASDNKTIKEQWKVWEGEVATGEVVKKIRQHDFTAATPRVAHRQASIDDAFVDIYLHPPTERTAPASLLPSLKKLTEREEQRHLALRQPKGPSIEWLFKIDVENELGMPQQGPSSKRGDKGESEESLATHTHRSVWNVRLRRLRDGHQPPNRRNKTTKRNKNRRALNVPEDIPALPPLAPSSTFSSPSAPSWALRPLKPVEGLSGSASPTASATSSRGSREGGTDEARVEESKRRWAERKKQLEGQRRQEPAKET